MNSSSSNITLTTEATTTFFDDGAAEKVAFVHKDPVDNTEVRLQDIRDFLAKPRCLNTTGPTSTWATTDLLSAQLFQSDPDVELKTIAQWTAKTQGFSLFRGTAVYRVSLNATPFHQGKLLLHFLPQFTEAAAAGDSGYKDHNFNIVTKCQQPHVELDCRDSVAIIKIPYVGPSTWLHLQGFTESFSWGRFFVSVLAPLKAGTAAIQNIEYSVFLHYEDVELSAPYTLQAGKRLVRSRGKAAAAEVEASSLASGSTISGAMAAVGKAATNLSSIPMISSVASSAAWVANALSATASYFGFSKPLNDTASMTVARQVQRYMATADGSDNSYPLSVSSCNSLNVTPDYSLTDEDEMSLKFLISVPAYIPAIRGTGFQAGFTFSTSQTKGTEIFNRAMDPQSFFQSNVQTINAVNKNFFTSPPITQMAYMFGQYRGSFMVHFRLAKTDFHSGRLLITWTPTMIASAGPTVAGSMLSLREVVDIRESADITIQLPYMLAQDYAFTNRPSGILSVRVLNELVCPETCNPVIDILWGVCGGPDFEFAAPSSMPSTVMRPFVLQSGTGTCASECIGNSSANPEVVYHAERCVGEKITSIRQLLRRNNQLFFASALPANGLAIWPFNIGCFFQNVGGATSPPLYGGDLLSVFGPMFRYYRGSIRLAFQSDITQTASTTLFAMIDPGRYSTAGTILQTAGLTQINGLNVPVNFAAAPVGVSTLVANGSVVVDGNGLYPLSVPYYSQTPVSLIHTLVDDTLPEDGGLQLCSQSRSIVVARGATTAGLSMFRAIGEDYNLSYFVGTRPWVVN
nr:MAG: capsid protein [Chemarfal virus 25]